MGMEEVILSGAQHPDNLVQNSDFKIILNDMTQNEEDRDLVNSQLSSTLAGDMEIMPTCNCGFTKSPLALSNNTSACPKCHSFVSMRDNDDIKPTLYMRTPGGVRHMFQSTFWMMMSHGFTKKKFNALLYLTNTRYESNDEREIELLQRKGLERGYNNFCDNIDRYLVILCKIYKKQDNDHILSTWRKYRRNIRTNHIYFFNKVLSVIEDTPTGKYADPSLSSVMDAAKSAIAIDIKDIAVTTKENMTSRIQEKVGKFYSQYTKDQFNGKGGMLRAHLCASRGMRITRLVISSITVPHKYDRIEIPWVAGIHMLRVPITSIMLRRGFTMVEIRSFLQRCSYEFNQYMSDILDELLAQSYKQRITTITQRFPTLKRGSLLKMYICVIKRDPTDRSLGYPILGVKTLNADYDGDGLHVSTFLDQVMDEILEPLEYHHNALSNIEVRKVSSAVGLSVPVATNLATWYETSDTLTANDSYVQAQYDRYG